ncbi:hypothetical protein QBC38DRAFT_448941 [Podospora fimiseda]|uniref:Uncharacterized protein n=1 Tax=Podospora fimiseda TaxID=252190 RepID=A0AAN6YSF2_9PEZI|nr:hypothetical protein QBC38DRAFT_448941 [Podospora fimiseda]
MDNPCPTSGIIFRHLPNELVLMILEFADDGIYQDWSGFVRVDRRCYELLNPILFRRGDTDAMQWGIEFDNLVILRAALRYSTQLAVALANTKPYDDILVAPSWTDLRPNLNLDPTLRHWTIGVPTYLQPQSRAPAGSSTLPPSCSRTVRIFTTQFSDFALAFTWTCAVVK